MEKKIQLAAGRVNSLLLPLFTFSLAVSTSALSVLAILIVLFWVIEGGYKGKLLEIFRNKVTVAVLIYLGLYVVGMLWTGDRTAGFAMLEKQWKLALLPFFLTVVHNVFCFIRSRRLII